MAVAIVEKISSDDLHSWLQESGYPALIEKASLMDGVVPAILSDSDDLKKSALSDLNDLNQVCSVVALVRSYLDNCDD